LRIVSSTGFTLLELIIVMVLVVVVLAFSTLFYANSLPSARLHATGQQLCALIRHTRDLAQTEGEDLTLVIDLDKRQYSVENRNVKSIPEAVSVAIEDPEAGEIKEGKYSIFFHATGGIDGGSIVLSYRKKAVTIQIDPILGSVLL
jgi:general secretion pathway protein H